MNKVQESSTDSDHPGWVGGTMAQLLPPSIRFEVYEILLGILLNPFVLFHYIDSNQFTHSQDRFF